MTNSFLYEADIIFWS